MSNLPSFRGRGMVGRIEQDGSVTPSRELIRYLDLIAQRASEVSIIQETTATAVGFATYPAPDKAADITVDYDMRPAPLIFAEYS